jgi:hypothetical protein
MYCPVCGADNPQRVKFCKRCGSSMSLQVTKSRSEITPGKLTGMFWAIAILALGGLGVIFGCMVPLLALGFDHAPLTAMAFLGFATVFGIAGLLIRQLSRLVSIVQANAFEISAPANPTEYAQPPNTTEYAQPQITGQPRAVPSVTEHTTRNFDPVYKEQHTRE